MAWNSPSTWTGGQLVGATDLNTQLRDNMLMLGGTLGYLSTVGIGQAPSAAAALIVSSSMPAGNVYGVQVQPTYNPTGASNLIGINIAANATGQAASSKYGIYVDAQTGGNINNYGVYINGPSGGSGINSALYVVSGGVSIAAGGLGVGLAANGPGILLGSSANAPTSVAGQVGIGSVTAGTASAGASGAVPAQVVGYMIWNINGAAAKVPYYAN